MRVDEQPPLEVVGREPELAVVRAARQALERGSGGVVLVEGEAGIGKSLLVAAALDDARAAGLRTVHGVAEELEVHRPFGVLVRAFEDAGAGVHLGTDAKEAAEPRPGFAVQEAILDRVESLAAETPLVLAVDDLQWADPPTLGALAAIARRTGDVPVLVLAAHRSTPPLPDRFREVVREVGGTELCVGPLDDDAVRRLVETVAGAPAGDHLLALTARSGGNPFFVIELVRALRDEEALIVEDGMVESTLSGLPPTLRQTILRRVRALEPAALDLLRAGAVLGGTFDLDDAAGLLERSAVALAREALAGIEAGLLEGRDDQLRIRHDLIREAVYEDMPPAIRTTLHRQAVRVLTRRGRSAAVVSSHLVETTADQETVDALRRAATELASSDATGALRMLDRALQLEGLDRVQRAVLMGDKAHLLVEAGDVAGAVATAEEALSTGPPPDLEAELHMGLGEALVVRGDAPGAVAHFEAARQVGGLSEEREAVLLVNTARAHLNSYDLEAAERDARAAERWADAHDDPYVEVSALTIRCRLAAFAADFDEAVRIGERAVRMAGDRLPLVSRTPHLHLGLALLNADRPDDALAVLSRGRALAEASGVAWAIASYHNGLIMRGFHSGAWDDATAEAEAARRLRADAGTRSALIQQESMLGLIWFHRGEYDLATEALRRAEEDFRIPGHDPGGIVWLLWLQALLAERDGDLAEAVRLLGAAFDLATDLRVHSVKLWYGPDLVRMSLAAGDDERARRTADLIGAVAEQSTAPLASAAAAWCRGMVEDDAAQLLQAVDGYAASSRPLDQAMVHEAAGATLARAGQRERAVAQLEAALATSTELGAVHDARRVTAALRDLGVRRGVRGPRSRPATGPDSLTPTERTVLDLVGQGLRNGEIAERLYVSRRTVETHVGRLYAKLQVENRVALAMAAQQLTDPA